MHLDSPLGRQSFHRPESFSESGVGPVQRRAGMDPDLPGQVDYLKEQIADLMIESLGRGLGFHFGELLPHLGRGTR